MSTDTPGKPLPKTRKRRPTRTSKFGVSRREAHDASAFYKLNMYADQPLPVGVSAPDQGIDTGWQNKIYCQSAESLPVPDGSIGLVFTSPPYNVGKEYDQNQTLEEYLDFIQRVAKEVYRSLCPGGRYVINVANLGRKPYIPMHAHFYAIHTALGFLPMGEIIWQKGKGINNSCAWGSWRSARSPRLRDLHEYLLVFAREKYTRPEKGVSDISAEGFMDATRSIWEIPAESARRIGHPAPFPLALAERVIQLYSFVDDVVLDPFMGSGTTCLAARNLNRKYVGVEISHEYCKLAGQRLHPDVPDAKV